MSIQLLLAVKVILEWLARASVPLRVPSPGFAPCSSDSAFIELRVRVRFQPLMGHFTGQEPSRDFVGLASLVVLDEHPSPGL